MGMIARGPFPHGWVPDADAVDAPPGSLLRADNMILDEEDILSCRLGSSKINGSPFADTDIHSLHTQSLNGVRYRMAGAGAKVYANGSALSPTFANSGDIQFGTHMGQIFMARSTSRHKYDGTTVRNWGILMTGAAAAGVVPSAGGSNNTDVFISGDSGESPAIAAEVGSVGFTDDRGGSANSALDVTPDANGQAIITKTFAGDTDFTVLGSSNIPATDDSVVSLWAYFPDPSKIFQISLQISINGATIWSDVYATIWFIGDMAARGEVIAGWNKLTVRRGDMVRGGPGTAGKDWSTVRMVRVVIQGAVEDPGNTYIDEVVISGGTGSLLNGDYEFIYVYVRDDGSYIANSGPSPATNPIHFDSAAAAITVPADASRDTQINQIWIFRRGETLDDWYRTVVYSGSITTGTIAITDSTSDQDALEDGILLDDDVIPVPSNIIGIEGPYYDRLFVLTATTLYPSRRLRPDNFADEQAIRVAGPDETALWVKKAHGGLYIGTTKEIYRLDGTGAELPDGVMDFTLTPVNIDNPPRNEAVAQEGSLLCYPAADGWRAFTGAGSRLLSGRTSLLYQGRTRHGVSPANLATGRFRAAICKSQLVATTPEGASTTTTTVLYRYSFIRDRWYRHVYPYSFRSIFREPDGTLIAGDNAGFVYELDEGTDDATTAIPIVIWTPRDSDGNGFAPKVSSSFVVNIDSGGVTFTGTFHANEDATTVQTITGSSTGLSPQSFNLSDLAIWRQLQLRLTASANAGFRLSRYILNYLALPVGVKVWDSGPMDLGRQDLVWVRRVRLKVRAAGTLTITPYFDDVEFDAVTIDPSEHSLGGDVTDDQTDKVTIFDVPVGRGYFGTVPRIKVESDSDFHPFWVEFQFRRTAEQSEKPDVRVMSGLGGEAVA